MKRKNRLWEIYFVFMAVNTINQAITALTPNTPIYNFYNILIAFDPFLSIFYVVRITCELLNIINLAVLFLYISNQVWLNRTAWKVLVIARISFDLIGHYYEFVMLKSLYFSRPDAALQILLWAALFTFPSYYACVQYAFQKRR